MITDRNKLNFVTICCCLSLLETAATIANALTIQQHQQQQQQQSIKADAKHQNDAAGAFENARLLSPRMDYNNEWRPVGRGDPLQNDPTYDYSPPALERVRYWAADKEGSSDKDAKHEPATANDKHDILLLGVGNEQQRLHRPNMPHAIKNAKGELPLLQPKYTSIRRSYYAHQLPTHLMPPPPMQSLTGTGGGMMKPSAVAGEYRHSMPPSFAATNAGSTSSVMKSANMQHSKPFYTSTATSPWKHTQAQVHTHSHNAAPASSTTSMMHFNAHSMPYGTYDSHPQESAHYVSYSRPSVMHTSESYSPNSIRPSQNALKHGSAAAPRKPWLHELLQKELIKPVRPTMPATKYLMGPATKPSYDMMTQNIAGISTTYKPVNFVTPPTTTTTSNMPPRQTTQLPMMAYTSNPIYITTTALPTTTTTKITTTTPSPFYSATRLLIPETSNLAFRPTVASMEMTTDALFSHYNQPEKPLVGPMYLIIEGHSKVKTYGKNELDPHQPKIVPIIPKREPIVRVGDPNSEQRGSVATFQVKHLHTKTTPMPATTTKSKEAITTTTTRPKVKTSGKPATTMTTTVRATMKMTMKPASKATVKPAEKTTEHPKVTTLRPTVTTAKPTTTTRTTSMTARQISTTARPISTTARQINTTHRPTTTTTKLTSTVTTKTAVRSTMATPNDSASTTYLTKFPTPSEAQPPTGMQGLLSLLDNIFQNEPVIDMEPNSRAPQLEARIGSNAGTISAEEESDVAGVITEPPREVRQVFDYDQLPDTRLKQLLDDSYEDAEAPNGGWLKSTYDDEEYDESMGESVKRFDKVMNYEEDDDELDIEAEEVERVEGAGKNIQRNTKLWAIKKA